MDQSVKPSDQSNKPNNIDFTDLKEPEPMGGEPIYKAPHSSQKNQPISQTPLATPQNQGSQPAPQVQAEPPDVSPVPNPVAAPVQTSPQPPQPPVQQSSQPPQPPAAPQNDQNLDMFDPLDSKSHIGSYILMGVLVVILILGILVFLSWKGIIKLGGLEKIWGGTKTSTEEVSASPSETVSPSISTSPETPATGNASPSAGLYQNDVKKKTDLVLLKNALNSYYQVYQKYPVSNGVTKTSDANSELAKALVPVYLSALPVDPQSPTYYYGYKSDGANTFEITAVLENKSDPAGTLAGNYFIYKVTNTSIE